MHNIREILRLHHQEGLGLRGIGLAIGGSPSSVHRYLTLASAAGLGSWADVQRRSEADLEALLYPHGAKRGRPKGARSLVDAGC
jgi:hypothetical protein